MDTTTKTRRTRAPKHSPVPAAPQSAAHFVPVVHETAGVDAAALAEAMKAPMVEDTSDTEGDGGERLVESVRDLSGPTTPDFLPSPNVTAHVQPGATARVEPAAMASWGTAGSKAPAYDMAPAPDDRDELTLQIGARYWEKAKRFEWALNYDGRAHEFTRFYFHQAGFDARVLVDIYQADSALIRKEVERKSASIAAHNEAHPTEMIGYLPIVRRNRVTLDDLARVKAGEIAPLIGAGALQVFN